jgi:hypothetical protein
MPRSATGRATNGLPQLLIHFRTNRHNRSIPAALATEEKHSKPAADCGDFCRSVKATFAGLIASSVSPLADSASMSYAIAYG